MNKIWLIIQREYLTRVRKKSFIIMSILGPVLVVALAIVPSLLIELSSEEKTIEVIDESGLFEGKFQDTEKLKFIYSKLQLEQAKNQVSKSKNDALLYIPKFEVEKPIGFMLFAENTPSFATKKTIEKTIEKEIEDFRLVKTGIKQSFLDSLKVDIDIMTVKLGESGNQQESSVAIASVVGYIAGFLIYMFIFFVFKISI